MQLSNHSDLQSTKLSFMARLYLGPVNYGNDNYVEKNQLNINKS